MSWSESAKIPDGVARIPEDELRSVGGCAAVHPDRRGGQHVAMECHGLMLIHEPTGIAVLVTDERSQHKNRLLAYVRLCGIMHALRMASKSEDA